MLVLAFDRNIKASIIKKGHDRQLSVINAKYSHDMMYGDVVINRDINKNGILFSGSFSSFNNKKELAE